MAAPEDPPQRRSARLAAQKEAAPAAAPASHAAGSDGSAAKRRRTSKQAQARGGRAAAAAAEPQQPQQPVAAEQPASAPAAAPRAASSRGRRPPHAAARAAAEPPPRAGRRPGGSGRGSRGASIVATAAAAAAAAAADDVTADKPRAPHGPPAKRKAGSAAAASGPSRAAEQQLWSRGYSCVAGVDEAGRGPLAGPVVAAAAVLPRDADFPLLRDSKVMSEEDREAVYAQLTAHPGVRYAVAVVDHETIDEINILQAAMQAMAQAVGGLAAQGGAPDHVLIDGNRKPPGLNVAAQLLVKGDASCMCIAAASVIAKVTRDRLMLQLDTQYPGYGFAQHKGYGVPAHKAAIAKLGPCAIHRRSFEPVKTLTGWAGYGQKAAAAAAAAKAAVEKAVRAAQQPCGRLPLVAAAAAASVTDAAGDADAD